MGRGRAPCEVAASRSPDVARGAHALLRHNSWRGRGRGRGGLEGSASAELQLRGRRYLGDRARGAARQRDQLHLAAASKIRQRRVPRHYPALARLASRSQHLHVPSLLPTRALVWRGLPRCLGRQPVRSFFPPRLHHPSPPATLHSAHKQHISVSAPRLIVYRLSFRVSPPAGSKAKGGRDRRKRCLCIPSILLAPGSYLL
jgi:hypothetical protein